MSRGVWSVLEAKRKTSKNSIRIPSQTQTCLLKLELPYKLTCEHELTPLKVYWVHRHKKSVFQGQVGFGRVRGYYFSNGILTHQGSFIPTQTHREGS